MCGSPVGPQVLGRGCRGTPWQQRGAASLPLYPDASAERFGALVRDCVETGSAVHTDGCRGYVGVQAADYRHQVPVTQSHAAIIEAEFPDVDLVVSFFKRWLTGTHHGSMGAKRLQNIWTSSRSASTAGSPVM